MENARLLGATAPARFRSFAATPTRSPRASHLRFGATGLFASCMRFLGNQDLAAELADHGAVLLVADGLHGHHAPVGLGPRFLHIDDARLGIDRVPVERGV